MMRSMFAGVSGLKNHQVRMDVIGNNIANVNTVGYKKSRVSFQDMLSQSIRGAGQPQNGRGGTNPQQVGLGMTIGSIDTIHTQGSSETTGKNTDMMISGDGFFMVGQGSNLYYTRAGNFDFDRNGNFVNPDGLMVQGWMGVNGVINTNNAVTGINIPKGQALQPRATTTATYINNLDASAPVGAASAWSTTLQTFDSLGNSHNIPITFTKGAANSWNITVTSPLPDGTTVAAAGGPLTFNGAGQYLGGSPLTLTLTLVNGATTPQAVNVNLTGMTQFASPSNATSNYQDGYASGVLQGYSIDSTGTITGTYSNGLTQKLAQVAVANFNNPAGLIKQGGNLYVDSNNSGIAQVGTASSGGRGDVSPGKLEMSNVDLSEEFTNMIVTERGFQANSKIITTSDEMLQELVNLKR